MSARHNKTFELSALARALRLRYPGVDIEPCERRVEPDGTEMVIVGFKTREPELLIKYGLARLTGKAKYGDGKELTTPGLAEWEGSGVVEANGYAYVYHRSCADDPNVGYGRVFPLKKTQKEFDRIWRRISAPRCARPI